MSDLEAQQGDLFEPGFGYRVQLPVFDGPLDLLLYLIRKHRIDIYDIPIALITEQYLSYLEQMQELDIDLAGEFLVMAATLMHIKSQMLLPQPEEPEEEGEDPRAQLVRMLLEYQAIKEASVHLAGRDILDRDVFVHTPHADDLPDPEDPGLVDVDLIELLKAFRRVLDRRPIDAHKVEAERYHVKDRMFDLAETLKGKERISFESLFESGPRTRPWLIVTFLAILELVRMKMLRVMQAEHLSEIYIVPKENLSADAINSAHIDTFERAPQLAEGEEAAVAEDADEQDFEARFNKEGEAAAEEEDEERLPFRPEADDDFDSDNDDLNEDDFGDEEEGLGDDDDNPADE